MGKKNTDNSIGHFLSKVLRHEPELIGLKIEREGGWADTGELIKKCRAHGVPLDMETLERIVRENNKQRYSFNEDKSRIRANQGHSIDVVIPMKEMAPPEVLYHGTSSDFLPSIKEKGLLKMERNFVHLSKDIPTAVSVGDRHTRKSGRTAVLVIDTARMSADGYIFHISDNGVWQSDDIPWGYVKEILYP